MGADVIVGADGRGRCTWAETGQSGIRDYHDDVWGTRTIDQSAIFESLTLGVFQAGLSWSIVFGKRDGFRRAFHGFDVVTTTAMTDAEIDELMRDPAIIRNRAKITATIANAHALHGAWPGFLDLLDNARTDHAAPQTLADIPTSTPAAERLTRELKSRAFRFVGPTSVYAFMQNVGVVNDHLAGCFRAPS
ncbi:DNA-3-methyladenine glycosylase I [Microbacterium deminutum]|uniref:DNA-3-methyladenine glycosylase n=1 Tax=Microbacterium deminutum TaxID=344164 RepID=A0ABN2R6Q6_9MICO